MRNHKKEQQASNTDAIKTLPMHKADKQLLLTEVEILQEQFLVKPDESQAQYLALKLWQFEMDHGFNRSLRDINTIMLEEVDLIVQSDDIGIRQMHREHIDHLSRYVTLFLQILDNPCLFSYHR